MLLRPSPRAALGLTLAGAALLAPAAASAATPSPAQTELVNRASGAAGAFTLGQASKLQARPEAITNDGRGAIFEYTPGQPDGETSALARGLYQRDLITNRTKKIAGGDAKFAGFDGSQHWIAFTTSQALSPLDTNGQRDLYATLDGAAPVLLSRSGDVALGVTGRAILTRNAKAAIFENNGTIYRRNLTTSRTAKLPQRGRFGGYPDSSPPDPTYASADGQVFGVFGIVYTPTRQIDLSAIHGPADGSPSVGPLISSSGDRAVAQLYNTRLSSIVIADTATGVVTQPPLPDALKNPPGPFQTQEGQLLRVSRDGRSAIVADYDIAPGPSGQYEANETLKSWNLETGVVTDLALPYALLSETLRFGIIGGGNGGILAMAAKGEVLPGTLDLPSPNVYVSLQDECTYRSDGPYGRVSAIGIRRPTPLPPVTSLRIQASTLTGAPLVDETVTPPVDFIGPGLTVPIASGTAGYSVTITATFPDGRTTTETSKHIGRIC